MIARLLRVLFVRRAPSISGASEDALRNYALDLAQEWGPQWLKPTQERLHQAYPLLGQAELDRLNSVAQAAMKCGHDLVYSMTTEQGREKVTVAQWRQAFSAQYPWVDEKNLRHLFSTGSYYAWKDGVG